MMVLDKVCVKSLVARLYWLLANLLIFCDWGFCYSLLLALLCTLHKEVLDRIYNCTVFGCYHWFCVFFWSYIVWSVNQTSLFSMICNQVVLNALHSTFWTETTCYFLMFLGYFLKYIFVPVKSQVLNHLLTWRLNGIITVLHYSSQTYSFELLLGILCVMCWISKINFHTRIPNQCVYLATLHLQ